MAKIGIITFNSTIDNSGQILQYLATQEYLKSLGHDPILVEPNGWERTFPRLIKWSIQITYGYLKNVASRLKPRKKISIIEKELEKENTFKEWAITTANQEKIHPRHFSSFRKKYFSCQTGTFDKILSSGYDSFCVGSDQTWSAAGWYWMLGWVPKKIRRFSIAPSVGHRKYTKKELKSFTPYLKKFDFITVRENNGIELCKQCGRNDAVKILDPVFLLETGEYNKFATKVPLNKPYVLIYMLGGEIALPIFKIIEFCNRHGLEVKYVESQGRNENIPNKIYATVEEWLGLISNAKYVITNSFHGTAFSIIYHKPFLVFPLINLMSDMNERIYDLTKQMELETRIYKDNLDILLCDINWDIADLKIKENKNWLKNKI